ncbi:hypothetical protein Sfr7A_27100 [Streptomyces xinghaiensis]|uniref:Uncharacterized protein n=1 Tax=Streptomyces xinghaiensis TaxID=1038928 RepID=A0A420UVB1_9ACTN|nr:hypothetical protein Sfr7A_27100 [Streptomyces xinghaiensis]RKM91254.1 hypothetical protein SFRA_029555 [Streptomyces xinghaiensis]RNC69747.1 hypothetical protein DC095_028640 [Streptomyces xinghaiensis]
MGCTHAVGCPLFPLLKAGMQSWRDHYCDSDHQWRTCARYQTSLTGERVPISLLPNGRHAHHLRRAADTASCGEAIPERAPRQAQHAPPPPPRQAQPPQPLQRDPWAPETDPWFRPPVQEQPRPHDPYAPYGRGPAAPEPTARFEPAPLWEPARPGQAPVRRAPATPDHRARHTRQAPGTKRGRWARLMEWMRGPA